MPRANAEWVLLTMGQNRLQRQSAFSVLATHDSALESIFHFLGKWFPGRAPLNKLGKKPFLAKRARRISRFLPVTNDLQPPLRELSSFRATALRAAEKRCCIRLL